MNTFSLRLTNMDNLHLDDIVNFIENYSKEPTDFNYDIVGVLHIFKACLRNISNNKIEISTQEINQLFNVEQQKMLRVLLNSIRNDKS